MDRLDILFERIVFFMEMVLFVLFGTSAANNGAKGGLRHHQDQI